MDEINIAPYIKELNVFNDPEYCKDEIEECAFLDKMSHITRVSYCNLFQSMIDNEGAKKKKCDQCKLIYQTKVEDEKALEIARQHKNGERKAVTQEKLNALLEDGFIEIADED